ncbi:hypothetical protein, partial [Vibrio caribbeanicus]
MTNNNLNIRQMQAYAAICLWSFCNLSGIKHASINQLIEHLLNMLTADSLPDWEQAGTRTDITGRGDSLPSDVENAINHEQLEYFHSLVECCVEIGIVDMYGASTKLPEQFFQNCINTAQQAGVSLPNIDGLRSVSKGSD